MSRDVVERALAIEADVTDGPWEVEAISSPVEEDTYLIPDIERYRGYRNSVHFGTDKGLATFVAESRTLVPALRLEVSALRARDAEMVRRDGECICDHNPDTTQGPEDDCPWHGRAYKAWVEAANASAAEIEHLKGLQRDDRQTAIDAVAERDAALAKVGELEDHVAALAEEVSRLRNIAGSDAERDQAQASIARLNSRLHRVLVDHRPYGLDCKCRVPINSDEGWARHVESALYGPN